MRAHVFGAGGGILLATLALLAVPATAAQEGEDIAGKSVRVPKLYTNVHQGPTTVREVLVLAPQGSVLPVVSKRGEWYEVELSPELRETGMVMRWYENEETGWVHQSTVELVDEESGS